MKSVLKLVALSAVALCAGSLWAASGNVSVEAVGDTLFVKPNVASGPVSVRVTGPDGFVAERAFGRGESAALALSEHGRATDGAYGYEVVLAPVNHRERDARETAGEAGAIESGTFHVRNGRIELPSGEAEAPRGRAGATNGPDVPEDQVIPDDLIVQGSTCVGFDCVNNESFGFDTIRLKENNLRIKFEDTSAAGFSTNDWQLTANDSAAGGSSKFSIEDITGAKVPFTVTAGAATNSVFVDSTGRVGFRTSTPVLDLHVNTSNTPALRLEQNNSGGFTAQTWDVAGNEANFFVRDVTGGSRLSFRIRPGAPTSSLDISSDGRIGMGTASPTKALSIARSDGNAQVLVTETAAAVATRTLIGLVNNGAVRYTLNNSATATTWAVDNAANSHYEINNIGNPGVEFSLDQTGNLVLSGTVTAPSDRNAKADIVDVDAQQVLAKVASMPISTWRYKNAEDRHMGPMAQDFSAAFGLGKNDTHIALNDLSGVALAAIKALNDVVTAKDAQLKALEQQNAELSARLTAIEAALAAK